MSTLSLLPALLVPLLASPADHSPSAVLLRQPDVSDTRIVFRYDGDLWLCPRKGGTAARLTSAKGIESLPRFSPDGERVAFMADYDGGSDIYVMDVGGGAPRRVTFHPGRETLCDWHPDGERLVFFSSEESGIARAPRIFTVHAERADHPEPLPINYGTFAAIDPGTMDMVAFTPLTRENRTWRRYRGGMAQEVWIRRLSTGETIRVTDDPATDRMPMWSNDRLLFQSDRGDEGIANLYEYDPSSGETRALTRLSSSGARFPAIGPKDVVFEQGGGLFRLDLATEEIVRVEVSIPGDRAALMPRTLDLAEAATHHSLSRSGKRLAVEARGEIFSVPVERGVTRNLTRSSGAAERWPSLSPDGRWVSYWSDRTGEYELYVRRADGSAFEGADERGERRLTDTGGGWAQAADWSPDSSKLCWSNHLGEIAWVGVEEGLDAPHRVIGRAHFPSFVDLEWSPDSRWIAWSARSSSSRLDALHLYDVEGGETTEVTSGLFDDSEPEFSRCGKWLFFHSSRNFAPSYADLEGTWIYDDTRQLMVMPLRADVERPWAAANVEEELESEDDGDGVDEPEEHEDDDAEEEPALVIELEGLEGRAEPLPVDPGILGGLVGLEDAVLFAAEKDGETTIMRIDLTDEEPEAAAVCGPVRGYGLSGDGSALMVLAPGDAVHVVEPEPDQSLKDPVDLSAVRGTFDPREEWAQMIRDVHRLYRDWFYDPGMHGVDWDALRDRTLSTLEDATSREDVHFLIGEMLAELNVGHAYNRGPSGGFEREELVAPAGLLGADWRPAEDGTGYVLEALIGAPLEHDGKGPLHGLAREGDVLTAINGVPVDPRRALHAQMLGTAGRVTLLELRGPGGTREVAVRPLRSERSLRYRHWVAAMRDRVHAASDGLVGYVHVPNTGQGGQSELYRQFMAERSRKALIIDERWNSGGQIPTRFIELLSRRPTNAWALRGGARFDWPEVYHDGPKVMLINHSAGSGGDAFPWYFRREGLGPLIGTRTWGGLVGISGNPALVDGASPSVPTFGFYELDGTWGVEGHGVDPDIEVIDITAAPGEDPQLDRALAELEAAMETWPYAKLDRPAAPDRRGAGLPEEDR